ncbi:hypothetical protein [Streptacidiphilus sp. EB103A]|uniref:hypothetical protein n=1 Tax=Streptacidiphilus sp. EB103A TaxID=3156275 RepID=UPI003517E935
MTVIDMRPLAPLQDTTELDEFDLIECDRCGLLSVHLDDDDQGHENAADEGWHIFNRDECHCPLLCGDCAHDWCEAADNSPRLIGMRVVG